VDVIGKMSVIVQYDPWGRMGNRMFQLAFGYLLAKQKGVKLYHDGLPNFNIYSSTKDYTINNPIYTKEYGDNWVNMEELLNTNRDIIVNSFVQQARYYLPYKQELRAFFNIRPFTHNQNKLVMHIRESDYILLKDAFLGSNFYKKMIENSGFKFEDVIIVSDNSNCDTVKMLVSEGCKLNSEGEIKKFEHESDARSMNDFDTLLQSENIGLSQSSFSWWTAFLGHHKTIIFPYKKEGGMWPITPNIYQVDLYFNEGNSKYYTNQ
jgi:hypothetical protein